jgi:hypothetical protein
METKNYNQFVNKECGNFNMNGDGLIHIFYIKQLEAV